MHRQGISRIQEIGNLGISEGGYDLANHMLLIQDIILEES